MTTVHHMDVAACGTAYAGALDCGLDHLVSDELSSAVGAAIMLARAQIVAAPDIATCKPASWPAVVFVRNVAERAYEDFDLRPLDEFLDWWHYAYLGAPWTGAFQTRDGIGEPLRSALLDPATVQPWRMLDVLKNRTFDAVLDRLEYEVTQRRRGNYNDVTPAIYLDAAESYARTLRDGQTEPDPFWIREHAEALIDRVVSRGSRYRDGPIRAKLAKVDIPSLQEIGAELERLRTAPLTGGQPAAPPELASTDGQYGRVLGPLLCDLVPFDSDVIDTALTVVCDELVQTASTSRGKVAAARALRGLNRHEDWVAEVLAPVDDTRRAANDLILDLEADVDLDVAEDIGLDIENWRDELERALGEGDLDEAQDWLELLRTELARERSRIDLTHRADKLESGLEGLGNDPRTTDARTLLDGARTLMAQEQFFAAQQMLATAAEKAGLISLRREPTKPAPERPPLAPHESGAREKEARDLYERGDVARARELLERLVAAEPWSPGAYLLLKIYGDDPVDGVHDARQLVHALRSRGQARNQHFVRLARLAVVAGMRELATESLVLAIEHQAARHDINRISSLFTETFGEPPMHLPQDPVEQIVAAVDGNEPSARLVVLADRIAESGDANQACEAAAAITGDQPTIALHLLQRAHAFVPKNGRPRVWHQEISLLEAMGEHAQAADLRARRCPPLPPDPIVVGPPAPGAKRLRAHEPTLWLSAGAPSDVRALAERAEAAAPSEAADLYLEALDLGARACYGPAMAKLVEARRYVDCLVAYRDRAGDMFAGAAVVWHVACSYAAIGAAQEAVVSFRLLPEIVEPVDREQLRMMLEFFASNEAQASELVEGPDTLAARSRASYERGEVKEATRIARQLAEVQPNNPGVLILFKIYREAGDVDAAERLVGELAQRDHRSWRLYVEYARCALDAREYPRARRALEQARGLDAPREWLNPLTARLAQAGAAGSYREAALTYESAGVPGIVRRADAGPLDPDEWALYVRRRVEEDRLGDVMGEAESLADRFPWSVVAVVDAVASGARMPDAPGLDRLIELTGSSGQLHGVQQLARVLHDTGRTPEAIALLRCARDHADRYEAAARPKLGWQLADAYRLGDDPDRARGVLLEDAPPLPPDPLPAAQPIEPTLVPPPIINRIVETPGMPKEILTAQNLADEHAPADQLIEAWLVAIREGDRWITLPPALGHMVNAGRPDLALEIFRERFGTQAIDWRGAWNIGCAYAARGELPQAADAFLLHARIASQTLAVDRREARDRILLRADRTPPEPAGLAAKQMPTRRTRGAVYDAPPRTVGQLETRGTETDFIQAVRRYTDLVDQGHETWQNVRQRVENWYARFERPGPETVSAVARLRVAAGDPAGAWAELWSWTEHNRIQNKVVETAVRVAIQCGRVSELRARLAAEASPTVPVAIARAKLAESVRDWPAMLRDAELAREMNPSSTEAIQIHERARRRNLPSATRTVEEILPPPAVIVTETPAEAGAAEVQPGTASPDATATDLPADPVIALAAAARRAVNDGGDDDALALVRASGPTLMEAFELDTRGFLDIEVDPLPERQRASLGERALRFADEGVERARESDWQAAILAFEDMFKLHPRSTHAVWNLCVALMNAGQFAKARRVAATMHYSLRGARLLAALDVRQDDPASAAARLEAIELRLPREHAVALGRAGILHFLLDNSVQATAALAKSARRGLPGVPHRHGVLAILLALERDDEAAARALLDELLAAVPQEREAIAWVCETGRVEVLGQAAVMALELKFTAPSVDALVKRFSPSRTSDLVRAFEQRVFVRAPADMACLDGLLLLFRERRPAARELTLLRRVAEEIPERRDAAIARAEQICTDNMSASGMADLTQLRERLGLPPDPGASEARQRYLETEAQLSATWRARLRTAEPHGPFTTAQEAQPVIEQLGRLMLDVSADTGDRRSVKALRDLWERQLQCIATFPDEAAQREFLGLDMEVRALQGSRRHGDQALLSEDLTRAATAVGRWLYQPWENLARVALVAEPLRAGLVRASRASHGPLEVVVQLEAEIDVREIASSLRGASVTGAARTIGQMRPGATREVVIVADAADKLEWPIAVEVGFVRDNVPGGLPPIELGARDVDTRPARVRSLFSPMKAAKPSVFRGRTAERATLAALYGSVGDGLIHFLEGPRQIGKTSLAESLVDVRGTPDEWLVPRTVVVYVRCDAERRATAPRVFALIAEEIRDQIDRLEQAGVVRVAGGLPEAPGKLPAKRFQKWCEKAAGALGEFRFLVVLDEVQVMLRTLPPEERLALLESLRSLNDTGRNVLSFLLCGSCTIARLLELMDGSNIVTEVESFPIGLIDSEAAAEIFRAGLPDVYVLHEAAERVTALSGGHPNWIHLVGRKVAAALEEQTRRVVDEALVDQAADTIAADPRLFNGQVNLAAEGPDSTGVLLELADEFRNGPDPRSLDVILDRFEPGARAERREQIRSFVHMGLMRFVNESTAVGWTNEMLWRALLVHADSMTRRQELRIAEGGERFAELRAKYGDVDPIPGSRAVRVDGGRLVAKQLPSIAPNAALESSDSIDPADVFRLFEQMPASVPEYRGRVDGVDGAWHVFGWIAGWTLADEVELRKMMNDDREPPREPMTTRTVARVIATVAELLTYAYSRSPAETDKPSLTHGDIKPSNIVVQATETGVLIDWDSATVDGTPTIGANGTFGYMAPAYLLAVEDGHGATHADDVFALGASMYEALTGELPYGRDLSNANRSSRKLPRRGIEDGLWEIVVPACAIDELDRFRSTGELAEALRSWTAG